MSLQVWLPLNGDLHNQGLSNISITNNGATVNDNGKIGKCYYLNNKTIIFDSFSTTKSICFWIKTVKTNSTIAFVDYKSKMGFGFQSNGYIIPSCSGLSIKMYDSSNFISNVWNHIALVKKASDIELWINGVLQTTRLSTNYWTNSVDKCYLGGRSTGTNMTCYLNDFRVYDHQLSQQQIKKISQGLILHYPLNDVYIESTENLITTEDCLSSTCYNGAISKYGYGTSTDMYKTVGIFQGKKCTKVYNQTNTTQMQPYVYVNNMFTSDGTNKPQYKTLSFDYYTTISTSLVPYKLGSGSGTASYKVRNTEIKTGSGTNQVTIPVKPNMWNHIQITFHGTTEANSEWGYIRNLPTHTSSTSNYWLFANMQLEEKDHATGYAGVAGVRNTSIVYDISGYQNNLNKNGTYSYTSDTPKYEVSTVFNGTEWMNGATPGAEILTLACWAKTSKNKSTSQFMIADSTSGLCISFYSGTIISYFGSGSQSTGSKCTLGSAYKENDWNHFVVVKTGTGTRTVYCNGVEQTPTSNDYWSSAAGLFIGSRKNSASLPFYGEMCDVRAYATALSAEDVLSLYNNGAYIDQLNEIHGKVR